MYQRARWSIIVSDVSLNQRQKISQLGSNYFITTASQDFEQLTHTNNSAQFIDRVV